MAMKQNRMSVWLSEAFRAQETHDSGLGPVQGPGKEVPSVVTEVSPCGGEWDLLLRCFERDGHADVPAKDNDKGNKVDPYWCGAGALVAVGNEADMVSTVRPARRRGS